MKTTVKTKVDLKMFATTVSALLLFSVWVFFLFKKSTMLNPYISICVSIPAASAAFFHLLRNSDNENAFGFLLSFYMGAFAVLAVIFGCSMEAKIINPLASIIMFTLVYCLGSILFLIIMYGTVEIFFTEIWKKKGGARGLTKKERSC